jgi:hypothetical protein
MVKAGLVTSGAYELAFSGSSEVLKAAYRLSCPADQHGQDGSFTALPPELSSLMFLSQKGPPIKTTSIESTTHSNQYIR